MPTDGPITLEPTNTLVRYLFNRHEFSASQQKVKPTAFGPERGHPGMSTFLGDGMTDDECWSLGRSLRSDRLKGRADALVSTYLAAGLQLDPDNDPPRHVYVQGWPDAQDEARLLSVRKTLADGATFFPAPAQP